MAKLWNYIFITIGLMLLFYVSGITTEGGIIIGQYNMTSTENLQSFKSFDWFEFIKDHLLSISGIATGIVIGLWTKASPYQYLSAAIATGILIEFLSDLISIANEINKSGSAGFVGWLVLLIMTPLVFGYLVALWEWIGGRD